MHCAMCLIRECVGAANFHFCGFFPGPSVELPSPRVGFAYLAASQGEFVSASDDPIIILKNMDNSCRENGQLTPFLLGLKCKCLCSVNMTAATNERVRIVLFSEVKR